MFYEILRITQAKKPRMLFLENVKGLLSADDGRCFGTIISSLDELGYDVEWQVLNSKNFGVPQNRERVFIIGHLRGKGSRQVFPLRECVATYKQNDEQDRRDRLETSLALRGGTRQRYDGETLIMELTKFKQGYMGQRIYDSDGLGVALRGEGGGQGGKTGLYMINLHQWRTGEYGNGIKQDESFTLDQGSGRDYCVVNSAVRSGDRGSLDRHKWDVINANNKIRRLTPVECERLQGFPDNWTEGVSDTQRYKQLGNAVTVNVIKAIGERILEVEKGG